MAASHVPGQGGAPVVPGQVEPFSSGRVGQGEHVRRYWEFRYAARAACGAPGE